MPASISARPGSHEPPGHYMPAGIACPLALPARWHCMPAGTTCPLALLARGRYVPASTMCPLASLQHLLAMTPLASKHDHITGSPSVTPTSLEQKTPTKEMYDISCG